MQLRGYILVVNPVILGSADPDSHVSTDRMAVILEVLLDAARDL